MRRRPRFLANGVVFWAALAAAASAQEVRAHIPGANGARGVSGSCMYGGDGKLLLTPTGAACPERQQTPASLASASELPASIRTEAAALFEERERQDVELARVREAVAYEDREAARRAVEASLAKIARHLEREARSLREIAARGAH